MAIFLADVKCNGHIKLPFLPTEAEDENPFS